jgi:hypothetical protein
MDSTNTLLITLAPYVVPIVFALSAAFYKSLVTKLPVSVRGEVETIVGNVVLSVEQTAQAMSGPAKKQQAIALISNILKTLHLSVPMSLIDVYIEAAVASLNIDKPKSSAPAAPAAPMGFTASVVVPPAA